MGINSAAPVWADAAKITKNRRLLKRAQRTALTITTTAYRKVSHAALCILTDNMPIYIKAKMKKEMYDKTRMFKKMAVKDDGIDNFTIWKEEVELIRNKANDEWQIEWNAYNKDSFTKKLIKNVTIFQENKKDIDHYTMQILTGHGIFNKYRMKIGKDDETKCWDCGGPVDEAEHVLFECPRWLSKRMEMESFVGERIDVDNPIELMTRKEENWSISSIKQLAEDEGHRFPRVA
jgi:Zn finger protein HypA/HybF involved in hydrogenase expression